MNFPFKLPDRYEPTSQRLEGGQGYVHIVKDRYLDRLVAVKLAKIISQSTVVEREIQAISSIKSRHVAELYDIVKARQSDWLGVVQEYVSGSSLDIFTQPDFEKSFLLTLWQIASGIADIHRCGIIHRDIKPANIRFDSEGVIKVLDFGLSVHEEGAKTNHGRGSRGYLAPEIYGTPPIRIKKSLDVYAFGATAWFLANGQLSESMIDIPPGTRRSLPSFTNINQSSQLSTEIANLLDLTLNPIPDHRPTMSRVRDEIGRHLLYSKHRALVSLENRSILLDKPGSTARFKSGADLVAVSYDGYAFTIVEASGDVYVNNVRVEIGNSLPKSCVLTLGRASLGANRRFVAVDMSNPGVVI